jgi:hypothetical protein
MANLMALTGGAFKRRLYHEDSFMNGSRPLQKVLHQVLTALALCLLPGEDNVLLHGGMQQLGTILETSCPSYDNKPVSTLTLDFPPSRTSRK